MIRRLILMCSLWLPLLPVTAQFDFLDFRWELADIAFSYPANWDEPFAVQRFGIESVILAESDARNPERSPDIPIIEMTLEPADEITLSDRLSNRLANFDIQSDVTVSSFLLDRDALISYGIDGDDTAFGIGAIAQLDDTILTIVGRVPIAQQQQFESVFNIMLRSMERGEVFGSIIPYGIVWRNSVEPADNLFFNLQAITLDEINQAVYATDAEVGLLRFDMSSGRLEEIIPNLEFTSPISVASSTDGSIYIADPDCPCIHVYQNGEWQDSIDRFNVGSPQSIQVINDNLYATYNDGQTIGVSQYNTDDKIDLTADEPFLSQPILFSTDDQLYTYDDRLIQRLENQDFTPINTLEIDTVHSNIQMAPDGTYILVQDNIVDFYTTDGLLIESLDINEYSDGTDITGLELGQDNTIYLSINGTGISEVLSISKHVPDNSIGLPTLSPYRISGSFLSEDKIHDIWLFEGTANQTIDLAIQGFSQDRDFSFSVELIAPDGSEVVAVEANNSLNANLSNIQLTADSIYEVYIDHVAGQGAYDITLITSTRIIHDADTTVIYGQLPESYSREQWIFEARGQTTVTFTAEAINPTQLDPQIALYNSRGQLIEQNDDSPLAQGNTAQIIEFAIPINSDYTIEVSRFEGVGPYRLTIQTVAPDN